MTMILAIDPGNIESGVVLIDAATFRPIERMKLPNDEVLDFIAASRGDAPPFDQLEHIHYAIEQIESFGMAVAHSVFEATHWAGRFHQACLDPDNVHLITRKAVKRAICNNLQAKDPNILQALVDRFAPDAANRGKGSKSEPGWFYGFAADMWAAYAVAVTLADRLAEDGQL